MTNPSPPSALAPLDTLWQARTLVWVLLAGEALAAVLAIAPNHETDRLTFFGVASLAIQWISLTSLSLLYVFRTRLAKLSPLLSHRSAWSPCCSAPGWSSCWHG